MMKHDDINLFKSPIYINKNEDNWNWSFIKKDTSNTFFNITTLFIIILLFIVYIL